MLQDCHTHSNNKKEGIYKLSQEQPQEQERGLVAGTL